MKKILLLGLAVLGLFACTPSANPIPDDPIQDPTNPGEELKLNVATSVIAPRKGGLVEIPVEYEGEYFVQSESYDVKVVSSKAMKKGVIVVSVGPNLTEGSRTLVLIVQAKPNVQVESKNGVTSKSIAITQEPVAKEVLFADIAGANALYIAAEQGGVSKSSSSSQKLYKIAATGAVDSVVFKDEYSDTATVKINYIRNLSDKYVYMSLTIEPRNVGKQYVVRKTDGAVFAAKPPYIYKYTEIQTDHRQNSYYQNGYPSPLYKMYDYNNGVDVAQLTRDYMGVNGYLVDPKGNVLFHSQNSLSEAYENLCYTASGEFAKSSWKPGKEYVRTGSKYQWTFVLKQMPENFYLLDENRASDGSYEKVSLVKLKSTIPAMTSEVLVDRLEMNGKTMSIYDWYASHTLDQMTLFLCNARAENSGTQYAPMILRIEGERSYKFVPLNRTAWPEALKGGLKLSKEHLYGFNADEIYRISIHTGIVETLYANNEYSIYDFNVGSDDVLTFSALELRKAQDVVCEIRGGQLKILQTDDSQKIIQLERIN